MIEEKRKRKRNRYPIISNFKSFVVVINLRTSDCFDAMFTKRRG
jgi:hypothetical protein